MRNTSDTEAPLLSDLDINGVNMKDCYSVAIPQYPAYRIFVNANNHHDSSFDALLVEFESCRADRETWCEMWSSDDARGTALMEIYARYDGIHRIKMTNDIYYPDAAALSVVASLLRGLEIKHCSPLCDHTRTDVMRMNWLEMRYPGVANRVDQEMNDAADALRTT